MKSLSAWWSMASMDHRPDTACQDPSRQSSHFGPQSRQPPSTPNRPTDKHAFVPHQPDAYPWSVVSTDKKTTSPVHPFVPSIRFPRKPRVRPSPRACISERGTCRIDGLCELLHERASMDNDVPAHP